MRSGFAVAGAAAMVPLLLYAIEAAAAPEARLLGIDARTGVAEGRPLLRTLVEVGEASSIAEVVSEAGCGVFRGDKQLDCIADAVGQDHAFWKPMPFSQTAARLSVRDGIQHIPLELESRTSFTGPTAWLVALDASSAMAAAYADARAAANEIAFAVGPNDFVRLVVFDDRLTPLVADSRWLPAGEKQKVADLIAATAATSPSHQATRSFVEQVKAMMTSFADLEPIPLHRVMVVLSNGATNHPNVAGRVLAQRATKGRLPEDDPRAPKVPIAMVPVFFAPKVYSAEANAARGLKLMEDLANPEVGGRFAVVRPGQGVAKANAVLGALWERTAARSVVRWRMPCPPPAETHTFTFAFQSASPPVASDRTFEDVPLGIDMSKWPLDVRAARVDGRRLRVTGAFCWGTEASRAAVQFFPKGAAEGVRVSADEVSDAHLSVTIPDDDSLVDADRVRFEVEDERTHRASPIVRTRLHPPGGAGDRESAHRPPAIAAAPPAKAGCGCDLAAPPSARSGLVALLFAAAFALRRRA